MKLRVKQDYRELRKSEYPTIGDQLDALWKGGDELTKMSERIAAVKEKYKKPNGWTGNEQP